MNKTTIRRQVRLVLLELGSRWEPSALSHDSTQEGFNNAVGTFYVKHGKKFENVSKEEYNKQLYHRVDRITTDELIKRYADETTHRLADEVETWWSKGKREVLGQVWRLGKHYGSSLISDDFKESYWINKETVQPLP